MTTVTKYYGIPSDYPKIVKQTSSQEGEDILVDVIFEELLSNKTFIKEANIAIREVIKTPDNFPNLTLKYKKLL